MADKDFTLSEKLEPFYIKVSHLNTLQKIGILLLTLIVISLIYVWLIYLPKTEKIELLEKKDKNLVMQVATARRKAAQLGQIRRELENRKEEYVNVMQALPDTKEIPGILSSISSSAKESGLDLTNITPGAESAKDFYAEIPISIKIAGRFHQTALFFDKVARFSRIINIRSVKISVSKDDGLSTVCNAVTYRFLKDPKNKEEKK